MNIVVKQVGRRCQVWHGTELKLESGRIACKGYALGLHAQTGDQVWNEKVGGRIVRVDQAYKQSVITALRNLKEMK